MIFLWECLARAKLQSLKDYVNISLILNDYDAWNHFISIFSELWFDFNLLPSTANIHIFQFLSLSLSPNLGLGIKMTMQTLKKSF